MTEKGVSTIAGTDAGEDYNDYPDRGEDGE